MSKIHLKYKNMCTGNTRGRPNIQISQTCNNNKIKKYEKDLKYKKKHCKNCECCPRHSLFKGRNVIVNIVVLNCQTCNQCLKCQVSGHKSLELLWNFSKNLNVFRKSETEHGQVMSPRHSDNISQGLQVSGIALQLSVRSWR